MGPTREAAETSIEVGPPSKTKSSTNAPNNYLRVLFASLPGRDSAGQRVQLQTASCHMASGITTWPSLDPVDLETGSGLIGNSQRGHCCNKGQDVLSPGGLVVFGSLIFNVPLFNLTSAVDRE